MPAVRAIMPIRTPMKSMRNPKKKVANMLGKAKIVYSSWNWVYPIPRSSSICSSNACGLLKAYWLPKTTMDTRKRTKNLILWLRYGMKSSFMIKIIIQQGYKYSIFIATILKNISLFLTYEDNLLQYVMNTKKSTNYWWNKSLWSLLINSIENFSKKES